MNLTPREMLVYVFGVLRAKSNSFYIPSDEYEKLLKDIEASLSADVYRPNKYINPFHEPLGGTSAKPLFIGNPNVVSVAQADWDDKHRGKEPEFPSIGATPVFGVDNVPPPPKIDRCKKEWVSVNTQVLYRCELEYGHTGDHSLWRKRPV